MTGEFHPIRVDQTRGLIVLELLLLLLGLVAALISLGFTDTGLWTLIGTLGATAAVLGPAAALMSVGSPLSWFLALLGQAGTMAVAFQATGVHRYLMLAAIPVVSLTVWITMNLFHPNVRVYLLTGVDPRH